MLGVDIMFIINAALSFRRKRPQGGSNGRLRVGGKIFQEKGCNFVTFCYNGLWLVTKCNLNFLERIIFMTQRIKSFFQKIGNGLRKVFVDPVRNMNSGAKFYISRTLPLVCAVLFAITAFTLDELGFAYRVEYGGKVIGYVNDVNSAKTAADRINSNIAASYGQKDLVLSYSSTLVLANKSNLVSALNGD